jgi:hypothetical protein
MKAKIVQQMIYEGWLGWSHGMGDTIKRLVIEEMDNLAITLHQGKMYAIPNFKIEDDCTILGEVEVPDKLIVQAHTLVLAQEKLDSLIPLCEVLLNTEPTSGPQA